MALISCPQCGKQVSNKALKCPHCNLDLTTLYSHPQPVPAIEAEIPPQNTDTGQKKSQKSWMAFAAGAGCLALVTVVLWFFVFKDMLKTSETEKKKAGVETTEVSTSFPYNTYFTGIIGAAGNMTLDSKGGGSYTYTSNEKSFTRSIKVKSYDRTSGHLLIESYNKNGDYVGLFDGYTSSNSSYSGTFTNYKGGTVEFRLYAKPR